MQRKAPGTTSQMRGQVLRLLERGDQRTYFEWLQAAWNVQQSPNGATVERLSGFANGG